LQFCEQKKGFDENEGFIARPAEDIPRNALVSKLVRGIQNLVQRLSKREGYRAKITVQK